MTLLSTLSEQQEKVYLSSLELGTDTIQNIANKAGLPRSTTYLIIDELKTKGLLSQTKKNKKSLIIAEPPEKLLQLAQQQQLALNQSLKEIEKSLPRLKAIHNTRKHKPLVRFYESFEGIKTILEQTLEAREILVLCSGYQKPMDKQLDDYLFKRYLPTTDAAGIKTREIITKDPDWKRYIKAYASANHQIKVSNQKPAQHHIDKLIFEDTVAILAYDALNGTVIQHPHIANFEKSLFTQLWKSLK